MTMIVERNINPFFSDVKYPISEPLHVISNNVCNMLTSVDSDKPVQPPFKLRNPK